MTAQPPKVRVGEMVSGRAGGVRLDFEVLAGEQGLDPEITIPYIQKTGLALAGFEDELHPRRILILGPSEIQYLEPLSAGRNLRILVEVAARTQLLRSRGQRAPRRLRRAAPGEAEGAVSGGGG